MRFVKTADNLFGLPTGFQRVAFLESTGTQYIDTGYKPVPATTKFEFYFSPTNITGNYFLFGARPDTAAVSQYTCTAHFPSGAVRQDWAGINASFPTTSIGNKYLYIAHNNTVSLNADTVTGTNIRSTTRSDYNFLLFTVNTAGTADTRRYVGKVYYAKLWDDGVLVRDFIPCIDPLGVPCMYDLVGKKPYYNQGTGEFTVGRQIIPVDYLESTGVEYIDTGIKFDGANTKIELKTYEDQLTIRHSICGDDGNFFYYFRGTGNWAVGYNGTAANINSYMSVGDNVFVMDKNNVYVNGVLAKTYTASSSVSAYNALLFNRKTSLVDNGAVTMYYCKIWNNSALVRDFIPCKDENNVGFMFDTVSGTVYENAGTGAFVVGNNKYNMKLRLIKDNILPTGYTQVEYIEAENNGNSPVEYAVGNYRLTDTTDWEITFSAENSNNSWVMGQPTWVGVHYRKDTTTGNLPRVGIVNSSAASHQCYVDYTNNEKITLALKGTDVYANGVKVGSITRASAPAAQTKYGIFAYKDINQDLPNLRIQSARIYRLKIWDNGVLVQDLIPAMKDGVAGFYERVNKTFIEEESNSTSDFTTGKPVLPIVRFPVDPVPAGYKTVNYLESTGTQYIDTGVAGSSTLKIEMNGQKSGASYGVYFGAGTGNNRIQAIYVSNQNSARIGNLTTNLGPDSEKFNVVVDTLNKNVIYNGTSYSLAYTSALTTLNIFIFTRNEGGSFADIATAKCWYFKIYDNNTLVRNFIPVVRLLDNKAGMWDTVTKQFYTTPVGDFITG